MPNGCGPIRIFASRNALGNFVPKKLIDHKTVTAETSRCMSSLDLSYPAVVNLFGDYVVKGRSEAEAFLAWFLENYYHLDSQEVDDSICEGKGDKGVDGIYVSVLRQQIDVFQTKIGQKSGQKTPTRGLGDVELKEFGGTLLQFSSPEAVNTMAAQGRPQLGRLLERLQISKRVAEKFEVRGIFITTKHKCSDAQAVLDSNPKITLYDFHELQSRFLPIDKAEPIPVPVTLDVSTAAPLTHTIEAGLEMFIALISASELVRLGGISNQELFAWNLRYSLERTAVNKAIDGTITDPKEHRYFPAFHNGLTILADHVSLSANKKSLTLSGYSVVNGCQSLNALFQKRNLLTPELLILTKIVSVSPKGELAQRITDRTNRQNGITGRDLQSNNSIQTRLQSEIHEKYTGRVFYRIAQGEHREWPDRNVIENSVIAKTILAFDCKEPESCHQHYKLFEEFHSRIFSGEHMNADRIVALSDCEATVREVLGTMDNRGFATYSLTPYLFLYLLREMLECKECDGKKFCENPTPFMQAPNGRERLRETLRPHILYITKIVAADLKQTEMEGTEFDYKRDLKNRKRIHEIKNSATPHYEMAFRIGNLKSFTQTWDEWKPSDFSLEA
jgi:hypothetical protein